MTFPDLNPIITPNLAQIVQKVWILIKVAPLCLYFGFRGNTKKPRSRSDFPGAEPQRHAKFGANRSDLNFRSRAPLFIARLPQQPEKIQPRHDRLRIDTRLRSKFGVNRSETVDLYKEHTDTHTNTTSALYV